MREQEVESVKKTENMTTEEYLEYARKKIEWSDKFSTVSLCIVATLNILSLVIHLLCTL